MEYKGFSLLQVFRLLKRNALIIVLTTVLFGMIGYVLAAYFTTPLYTAKASMYVYSNSNKTNTNITYSDLTASQELVNTYLVVLMSDNLLNQVIANLNLQLTTQSIRSKMSAAAIDNTQSFSISYTDADPNQAQTVVNAVVKLASSEITRVIKAGGAEVIDYAKVPNTKSSPRISNNVISGAVIGFILSSGIFISVALLDTKIRHEEDITENYELPVLASIPTLVDHISKDGLE